MLRTEYQLRFFSDGFYTRDICMAILQTFERNNVSHGILSCWIS